MSYEALRRARQLGQDHRLSRCQRGLLEAIADHWNPKDGYAWPNVETLAGEVGCSERQVQRDLPELEVRQLVVIRRGGGRKVSSEYALPFMDRVTHRHRKRLRTGALKGDTLSQKGDTVSPEPVRTSKSEPVSPSPSRVRRSASSPLPGARESDTAQRGDGRENKGAGSDHDNGRRPRRGQAGDRRQLALAGGQKEARHG